MCIDYYYYYYIRFLGCAESACVYTEIFVMQRDRHMTAVARLSSSARCTAHTSKKEELLLIARARRSAWKDAYQQLTGRVVAGMACSTVSSCSFVG